MKLKLFTVSYGAKSFSGMIYSGVFDVKARHESVVQEKAFKLVTERMKEISGDEDTVFNAEWFFNLQNINISVAPAN